MTSKQYRGGKVFIPSSRWKVLTISKDGKSFMEVGEVFVSGKRVGKEMDDHRSIKGYERQDIAKKIAERKFPKANPVIVEEILE